MKLHQILLLRDRRFLWRIKSKPKKTLCPLHAYAFEAIVECLVDAGLVRTAANLAATCRDAAEFGLSMLLKAVDLTGPAVSSRRRADALFGNGPNIRRVRCLALDSASPLSPKRLSFFGLFKDFKCSVSSFRMGIWRPSCSGHWTVCRRKKSSPSWLCSTVPTKSAP